MSETVVPSLVHASSVELKLVLWLLFFMLASAVRELQLPNLSRFVTCDSISFRVNVALAGLSAQQELLKGSTSEKLADSFH